MHFLYIITDISWLIICLPVLWILQELTIGRLDMVSDSHHDEFYADCQDCVFFRKGYALEIQGFGITHSNERYHTVIILNKADLLTTIHPPAIIGEPTGPRKTPF